MRKTLVNMAATNGFTFITVATINGCQVDKVFVFNKLGLRVVPNSSLSRGQSLFPLFMSFH
jgi:hypothetical protein